MTADKTVRDVLSRLCGWDLRERREAVIDKACEEIYEIVVLSGKKHCAQLNVFHYCTEKLKRACGVK